MKDIEVRLISELLKNSRRSDRELARAIKSSQPTVTRLRTKLEKAGYFQEYTTVPNFIKIGYHLFALTFVSVKRTVDFSDIEKIRNLFSGKTKRTPNNIIVIEKGIGLGCDIVIGSFHRDYASYARLAEKLKSNQNLEKQDSFLINLDDNVHYRYLTLATLAQHLLEKEQSNPNE